MRQTNIEEKKYSKHKKSPRFLEDFAVRTGAYALLQTICFYWYLETILCFGGKNRGLFCL